MSLFITWDLCDLNFSGQKECMETCAVMILVSCVLHLPHAALYWSDISAHEIIIMVKAK